MVDDAMDDPGLAGIFATYPAAWLSTQGGMGDQVIELNRIWQWNLKLTPPCSDCRF